MEADVYKHLLKSKNLRKYLRRKASTLFTPRNHFILLTHEYVDIPFILLPNEPEDALCGRLESRLDLIYLQALGLGV